MAVDQRTIEKDTVNVHTTTNTNRENGGADEIHREGCAAGYHKMKINVSVSPQ
jgi:hypothetical protein